MEDQAGKIIGEIGQCQFRFSTSQANGPDEQTEVVFLMGKDVLNAGSDLGFLRIGFGCAHRHGLVRRFATMNAAGHHVPGEPFLISL